MGHSKVYPREGISDDFKKTVSKEQFSPMPGKWLELFKRAQAKVNKTTEEFIEEYDELPKSQDDVNAEDRLCPDLQQEIEDELEMYEQERQDEHEENLEELNDSPGESASDDMRVTQECTDSDVEMEDQRGFGDAQRFDEISKQFEDFNRDMLDPSTFDDEFFKVGRGGEEISNGDIQRLIYLADMEKETNFTSISPPKQYIPISEYTVNVYIRLMCEYVNDIRSSRKMERPPGSESTKSPKNTQTCWSVRAGKSVEMLDSRNFASLNQFDEFWGGPKKASDLKFVKDVITTTPEEFTEMDYFFIPYRRNAHFCLLGFAPRQSFAFAIDNIPPPFDDFWDVEQWPSTFLGRRRYWPLDKFLETLIHFVDDDKQEFQIYTQWEKRSKTEDGSPNCVQQKDCFSCAVFTSTNAMCLGMGYDLMCYQRLDVEVFMEGLGRGKRPRMFGELVSGGFGKDPTFAYDLLEVPQVLKGEGEKEHEKDRKVIEAREKKKMIKREKKAKRAKRKAEKEAEQEDEQEDEEEEEEGEGEEDEDEEEEEQRGWEEEAPTTPTPGPEHTLRTPPPTYRRPQPRSPRSQTPTPSKHRYINLSKHRYVKLASTIPSLSLSASWFPLRH